jgi:hypothetical protein
MHKSKGDLRGVTCMSLLDELIEKNSITVFPKIKNARDFSRAKTNFTFNNQNLHVVKI